MRARDVLGRAIDDLQQLQCRGLFEGQRFILPGVHQRDVEPSGCVRLRAVSTRSILGDGARHQRRNVSLLPERDGVKPEWGGLARRVSVVRGRPVRDNRLHDLPALPQSKLQRGTSRVVPGMPRFLRVARGLFTGQVRVQPRLRSQRQCAALHVRALPAGNVSEHQSERVVPALPLRMVWRGLARDQPERRVRAVPGRVVQPF